MSKFLAIYTGQPSDGAPPDQATIARGMQAWGDWMARHADRSAGQTRRQGRVVPDLDPRLLPARGVVDSIDRLQHLAHVCPRVEDVIARTHAAQHRDLLSRTSRGRAGPEKTGSNRSDAETA